MFALSLFSFHISDLKYKNILPFLDSLLKSKENSIQNVLAVAKWLSVLLLQYK